MGRGHLGAKFGVAFGAEHHLVSGIDLSDSKDIRPAFERMLKGDVRYRFVMDMAPL